MTRRCASRPLSVTLPADERLDGEAREAQAFALSLSERAEEVAGMSIAKNVRKSARRLLSACLVTCCLGAYACISPDLEPPGPGATSVPAAPTTTPPATKDRAAAAGATAASVPSMGASPTEDPVIVPGGAAAAGQGATTTTAATVPAGAAAAGSAANAPAEDDTDAGTPTP